MSTLASFNGSNGYFPEADLIMDSSGNLYGTTNLGGPSYNPSANQNGYGTVFELAHGSGTITALASFNGTDSSEPVGGLVMDSSGNLYGTTKYGGSGNYGTVFEVAAGSSTISTLASFNRTDGAGPLGDLIMDSSGNLYGTTSYGGASECGTVFELAHGSGTITALASFDGANGDGPYGGLLMDSSGNFYGTTRDGGPNWNPSTGVFGDGVVFELAHGSQDITRLASFNGTNGSDPYAALIMDSSGDLYGTTFNGGATGYGTVFGLAQGSGTISTLATFDGTDGANPVGGLVMDSNGNLYGTACGGGPTWNPSANQYGYGTVFELAKGTHKVASLGSFNGADGGGDTLAGLILDSSGDLYGTSGLYGTSAGADGTIFELPGAAATTDQWTGANFAVDTNWSDGANWSLGAPPTPSETALFTDNSSVQSFTSTVDAGFTNAIGGLVIDSTWAGTITVDSALTANGNFAMASGTLGGSGAVTVAGDTMQWTGGQIDVGAGGFTNTGVLNANTTGGDLVLSGAGTLTNSGTINEAGKHSLLLENSATLDNAAGAVFNLTGNGGVSQSGGGTFSNAGTLEKTGGTGTSAVATTALDNTGTVEVNVGKLDISAAVTQVSGRTLTAGTWTVSGTAGAGATLDITSAGRLTTIGSAAQVTLDGPGTAFTNLSGLATISNGGSLSLLGGESFTTAGALTDKGSLTLGAGSVLTVQGSITQTSSGVLSIGLGGTNRAPTFGQLVSTTATVTLAGSLDVTSAVVPAVGSAFELLDNEGGAPISGTFKRLPEGATLKVKKGTRTLKFQISYLGTDAEGGENVLITRIS
jgi:uncharacterized repeat protein (TIGR03803 family)